MKEEEHCQFKTHGIYISKIDIAKNILISYINRCKRTDRCVIKKIQKEYYETKLRFNPF